MRLGIVSAVASALIGFVCAAVPLAAADAQAPAPAAAPAVAMSDALDATAAVGFLSKFKPPKTPDANANAAGMAAAPAMIAAAGVDCTPTDARLVGSVDVTDKNVKTSYKAVEAACKDNLGLILLQANDKVTAADCLSAKHQSGDNVALTCTLPANANAVAALQPYLVKAHSPCVATRGIYMGESATVVGYEVACQSGTGEIVQIGKPRTPNSSVVAASCAAFPRADDAPYPCTLTTEEANMAPVRALASQAKPPCDLTKTRVMGHDNDGSEYYEFACKSGVGVVVHASATGALLNTMTCGQAGGLGGGCKFTDAKASLAEATADYAAKAKAAGFDCNVSKFTLLPAKTADIQAVELACQGGNGGVMITKADKSTVFNCGRSQAEGYACSLSDKKLAFTAITEQLKAMDKQTCVASAISPRASATTAWIEVACSDGAPGFMIKYPRDSNTPSEVITCPEFTKRGAGDCALPTNKKAA